MSTRTIDTGAAPLRRLSFWLAIVALALLPLSDLAITVVDPWDVLARMLHGAVTPSFANVDSLWQALFATLAFGLQGVALGAVAGFLLSFAMHWRPVRVFAAFIRAIHELFWALIFLQLFGLTPLTGLLAIAIPYAGTFARVYRELMDETDPHAADALPAGTPRLSALAYTRLANAWPHLVAYTSYRTECALRSSAVLGFIGLPTLGFHLESAFRTGDYSGAAALLYLFFAVIASLRWWLRKPLLPAYLLAAVIYLPPVARIDGAAIYRFLTEDIVPAPLRNGDLALTETWQRFGDWLWRLVETQVLPGTVDTLLIGGVSLVVTGIAALALFPLVSPLFLAKPARAGGHALLIALRSTPEYVLAFIGLLLVGPSALPGIFALSLHNGAIIAHLMGRWTAALTLREDAPRGMNRYFFEVLPRIYRQFLAFLFYRWEIIMRETAILGILGVTTLGFYIDSAFAELRFDRALLLILAAALLNIAADQLSLHLRERMRLKATPETL
ncbi:MAG: PhnE/PtxC family ABC transporter permease [Gammaproteobacteria bacterium]